MKQFQVGVMLDSFQMDLEASIGAAQSLGAEGVQISAVQKSMNPDVFDKIRRRDLLDLLKAHGLKASAVCGDLGGYGFRNPKDNQRKITQTIKIIQFAKDIDCDIVTTHVGVIPDENNDDYLAIFETCQKLGEQAEKMDACLAIETGPEKVETLKTFLDALNSKGIRVNYDPANLVMITGDDPVRGVYTLKDYIVHTHAKDGIMRKQANPKLIYDFLAEGGIGDLRLDTYFVERSLGEGGVDFENYLKALCDIGYNGFLTVEREVGQNPYLEISNAVRFLRKVNSM